MTCSVTGHCDIHIIDETSSETCKSLNMIFSELNFRQALVSNHVVLIMCVQLLFHRSVQLLLGGGFSSLSRVVPVFENFYSQNPGSRTGIFAPGIKFLKHLRIERSKNRRVHQRSRS